MLAKLIAEKQDELSVLAGEKLAEDYLDPTRPAAVRPLATLDAIASLGADSRLQ